MSTYTATASTTASDGTRVTEYAGWNGHRAILAALADAQMAGRTVTVTVALGEGQRDASSESDLLWNLADLAADIAADADGSTLAAMERALLVWRETGADAWHAPWGTWRVRISRDGMGDVVYTVR